MTVSILDQHFDEFHEQLMPLMKNRDHAAAEALCNRYIALADKASDPEAAAMFLSFLASTLSIARRNAEALEAYERAERYVPTDSHPKIATATFLIWALARPQDGLKKLAEAEPFLQSFGDKADWYTEHGIASLAVGRTQDAVQSMRALADPKRLVIMRTYISLAYQVDLRLVTRMVDDRLALPECVAYLEVAEAIGSDKPEPREQAALKTVRDLLAKAQAGA